MNSQQLADTTQPGANQILDLFDKYPQKFVPYYPIFKALTGSTSAAILLQQMLYWSRIKDHEPFYKFIQPCNHRRYKPGDSWTEELGWSYQEFQTAIKKIGAKVTTGTSKKKLYATHAVIYWTDKQRVTWYQVNEPFILQQLMALVCSETLGNSQHPHYLVNGHEQANDYLPMAELPLTESTSGENIQKPDAEPHLSADDSRSSFDRCSVPVSSNNNRHQEKEKNPSLNNSSDNSNFFSTQGEYQIVPQNSCAIPIEYRTPPLNPLPAQGEGISTALLLPSPVYGDEGKVANWRCTNGELIEAIKKAWNTNSDVAVLEILNALKIMSESNNILGDGKCVSFPTLREIEEFAAFYQLRFPGGQMPKKPHKLARWFTELRDVVYPYVFEPINNYFIQSRHPIPRTVQHQAKEYLKLVAPALFAEYLRLAEDLKDYDRPKKHMVLEAIILVDGRPYLFPNYLPKKFHEQHQADYLGALQYMVDEMIHDEKLHAWFNSVIRHNVPLQLRSQAKVIARSTGCILDPDL